MTVECHCQDVEYICLEFGLATCSGQCTCEWASENETQQTIIILPELLSDVLIRFSRLVSNTNAFSLTSIVLVQIVDKIMSENMLLVAHFGELML